MRTNTIIVPQPSLRRQRQMELRQSEITVSKTVMISEAFGGDASSIVMVVLVTQSLGLW